MNTYQESEWAWTHIREWWQYQSCTQIQDRPVNISEIIPGSPYPISDGSPTLSLPGSQFENPNTVERVMELKEALSAMARPKSGKLVGVVVWYDERVEGSLQFDWRWFDFAIDLIRWVRDHYGMIVQAGMGYQLDVISGFTDVVGMQFAESRWNAVGPMTAGTLPCQSRVMESAGIQPRTLPLNPVFNGGRPVVINALPDAKAQIRMDCYAAGVLQAARVGQDVFAANSVTSEPVATISLASKGDVFLKEAGSSVDRVHEVLDSMMMLSTQHSYGEGVTICVLDTGASGVANRLYPRPVDRYDATGESLSGEDGNGHGSFCISEILGGGDQHWLEGSAPASTVIAIKVLTDAGWGTDSMIARGILLAIKLKADVISMSLGGGGEMPEAKKALVLAARAGILIAAAAGNDSGRDDSVSYPARYEECLPVAAVQTDGQIAGFSNWGPDVYCAAVGVGTPGFDKDGTRGEWSGTSMATPHCAASLARCVATARLATSGGTVGHNPSDALADTCRDVMAPGRDTQTGAGMIQLAKAQLILTPVTPPIPLPVIPPITPPITPPGAPRDTIEDALKTIEREISIIRSSVALIAWRAN